MRLAAIAFWLALLPAAAAEPQLPAMKLTYSVTWTGIYLGDATLTLTPAGADCYRYESKSDPIKLVQWFYGMPHELSEFCVAGGRVVPRHFEFVNPKSPEDSFTLDFDAAAGKVRDAAGHVRDIPPNAQDRFGIQQAVRLWVVTHLAARKGETVEFATVDDRHIRKFQFALSGAQDVKTPAGSFHAVVLEEVGNPRKVLKFWLAPERDYMPVKVEQVRGATSLKMVLLPPPH